MDKTLPISLAKGLRAKQTEAEAKLWYYLKNRQLEGVKFRRQQILDNYIVDFISFENKLIVEVDGGQHNEDSSAEKDNQRTRHLENFGYKVLRFWNNDIMENIEGVLETIRIALQ